MDSEIPGCAALDGTKKIYLARLTESHQRRLELLDRIDKVRNDLRLAADLGSGCGIRKCLAFLAENLF